MIRKAGAATPAFTRQIRASAAAVVFVFLLAAPAVRAQAPTDNGAPLGMTPGSPEGAYALSGFENVNLYNGSLSFSFPLLQVGGRGGAGYTAHVPIDAKWMVTRNEWYDQNDTPQTSLVPTYNGGAGGAAGYGPGAVAIKHSQWKPEGCYIGAQYFTTYRWASVSILFTAPDGTQHELVDQGTRGQPTSYPSCSLNGTFRGPVFVSKDENGMTFIADAAIRESPWWTNNRLTGYLKMPDGTVYRVDSFDYITQWASYYTPYISWIRDPNGNKTTFGYTDNGYGTQLASIKDSLNRKITIEYGLNLPTYGACDRLTYKGFAGGERKVHVSYGSLGSALRSGSLDTPKGLFPQLDGDADGPFDPTVVTSIWMPDGDGVTRRYRFKYNKYGELARVELSTGGAIDYDWGAGLANGPDNGLIQPVPNVSHVTETVDIPQIYRRLHGRHAYDAGGVLLGSTGYGRPETQNYDRTISNAGYVSVGHFDENGQQVSAELHYFYGSPATSFFTWAITPQYMPTYSPFPSYREGREHQTDYLAADGSTLLRRVTQSWDQPWLFWWYGGADAAPANCPFVKETVTTLADSGQVTKTTNVHPQTGQIMIDQFGNPIDVWVYDYGPGQPGGLLRRTHTEFLTVNPVNGVDYTNRTSASAPHMLSLPKRMSVYGLDGANEVERARTTIEYDDYSGGAWRAPLVGRSNISGLDPSYGGSYVTRGNPTATTRHLLTNGSVTGSITGYAQYDVAGNVVKSIDARGNQTTYDFDDRFGTPDGDATANSSPAELIEAGQASYAFATSATNALGHTSYTQYDYHIGKAVDARDANGTTYSGSYADALDRPTEMISGANLAASLKARMAFSYDDVNRVTTRTSDFNSFAEAAPLKSQTRYDGVGRTTETRRYETAGDYVATRVRYDALGRVSQSSNPFRNGETPVWTTTSYDELGRVRFVTTPDAAVSSRGYAGNSATATDQAGKKQRSVSDALGRVTEVYEDPDGANWLTSYSYDALDNLTGVSQYDPASQVTQTRSFVYDSLKRLVSTWNPERGAVNYVYDEQGNIVVQTDARGVSGHASYDALNRLTRRWYNGSASTSATANNSPALPAGVGASDELNYFYDSQNLPAGAPPGFSRGSATGRLVAVTYGGASAGDYYGYDALGRASAKVQQTGGVNYQTTATYNNGGATRTVTYPSGHVVNYNYDAAGRLGDKDAQNLAMTGDLGDGVTRTYSTGIAYSAFGGMSSEQYGTQTPIYNKSFYNVRGQLTEIRVATTANDTFWNRGAIINHYSNLSWAGSGPDNNGNLHKQDIYIPNDDAITGYSLTTSFYYYDAVNRLDWMQEVRGGAASFVQDYDYDRFGNRKVNPTNTWGVGATQFTVSPSNNRLGVPPGQYGAMSYDQAGNLTEDTYTGQGQRKYDAWNRMTQAWANGQWQSYAYDGNGRRVRRNANGVETWQVYGLGGELMAEYAAGAPPTQPQREYGYRGGQVLVSAESGAETVWVEDSVPAGASAFGDGEGWNWVGSNPAPYSGSGAHQSNVVSGMHQHFFAGASAKLTVAAGEKLYAYVYLDPASPPTEVMLQWNSDQEGWNHRAYWGADQMGWGANGTGSRRHMGGLPASGQWVRLEVPASLVGLEGKTLNGMAFTLYGGGATWDRAGKASGSSAPGIRWLVTDQLGTPRMVADKTGSLAGVTRHDYLPFGEELFAGYGGRATTQGYGPPDGGHSLADGVRRHFTGYERDGETGLDYAQARYYASAQGRFTGADAMSGVVANPQSWNGYAYTLNNPVNLTDPTGMFANAEYSGPSWEVEGYGDMWRRRSLWTEHMERALAAYEQMVEQGRANLAQRRKKRQQQPQPQPQPQVVDVRKDKIINAQVEQIKKNKKEPAAGQKPVLTSIAVIPGETYNVANATIIDAYGRETEGGWNGVIQPIAYVPLDQFGNILPASDVGLQEVISRDNGPRETNPPDRLATLPPGGAFIDMQAIATGEKTSHVKQMVAVVQSSTRTVFTVGQNIIVQTPPSGRRPGSISFTQGPTRRRDDIQFR